MLYKLWQLIQLFLPYGLIIQIYKHKKAIPANIRTRTGNQLKAIMITNNYGILFTSQQYIKNRVKLLREKQTVIDNMNKAIAAEMNSLSIEARELFFSEENNENS